MVQECRGDITNSFIMLVALRGRYGLKCVTVSCKSFLSEFVLSRSRLESRLLFGLRSILTAPFTELLLDHLTTPFNAISHVASNQMGSFL